MINQPDLSHNLDLSGKFKACALMQVDTPAILRDEKAQRKRRSLLLIGVYCPDSVRRGAHEFFILVRNEALELTYKTFVASALCF